MPAATSGTNRGMKHGASTLRCDPVRLIEPRQVALIDADASEHAVEGLGVETCEQRLPCSKLDIIAEIPECRRSTPTMGEE
eukprot:scaffold276810_cov35-Tisochrysis_lutea.AAC.2